MQTPVPLTYARHTSRFLSLFCLTAPIALVGELGWYIIPFVTMVTWSLFGILEIGMMIEEPFQRALKLEVGLFFTDPCSFSPPYFTPPLFSLFDPILSPSTPLIQFFLLPLPSPYPSPTNSLLLTQHP